MSQEPENNPTDNAPAAESATTDNVYGSDDAKAAETDSGESSNTRIASELVKDLQNDDELVEAILDFEMPTTDDGKDSNYEPSGGSSSENKNSLKKTKQKKQPQFDSPAQPKKTQSKKAPVRVYRDPPTNKTKNSSASPPRPQASSAPGQQLSPPLIPGSYYRAQPIRPGFRPNAHPFNRFQRYAAPQSNWRTPRFPRPQNSYPRPSLRYPLSNLQPNVPLQYRNVSYGEPLQYLPPNTPMFPGQQQMPPLTANMPSPPPASAPAQPPPQQPPSSTQHSTPPEAVPSPPPSHLLQNPRPAQPTQRPSPTQVAQLVPASTTPSSATTIPSVLDPATGIIRPSHDYIVRMNGLGLKIVYAVAWTNGGAVFLSQPEATISHNTASSAGSNPLDIRTFADVSLNLFQNEALAINWILENKARLAQQLPRSDTPPSQQPLSPGMSAPLHPPSTTPPPSTHNQAQMYTPSPQAPPIVQTNQHQSQYTPQPSISTSPPSQFATPTISNSATGSTTLLSADEWSFSQEDILVRKCLLNPSFAPITIENRTPNPNRLPYLAAPGSAKGIIISGPESSLQKMVIDPTTGSISIRPRHLQTLRLLDFPTFLSLMFRAIDMTQRENSQAATQAATAVRTLLRDLTRQYESLQWSSEPSATWMFNAYLRWTHMVLTRVLLIGFNSEQAFLSEARNRVTNSNHASRLPNHSLTPNTSPLIHSPNKNSQSPITSKSAGSTNPSSPPTKSSHWFICPCCGVPNDHFSPACPTQADGPKPIPKYVQESTRASIDKAPITQSARSNLLRMATSLYAKLDKSL